MSNPNSPDEIDAYNYDDYDDFYEGEDCEDCIDESMDGDHDSSMTSAGWGTDEDYGYYGNDD